MKHVLEDLLSRGVDEGVFPLARAEVWFEGAHVFSGGNAPPHTWFDLASLTKVMCTTPLVLDSQVDLARPLRDWLPDARTTASLDDLLFHRSGLPAFLPFFADELNAEHRLFDAHCPPAVRALVRGRVLERVAAVRPEAPPGARTTYSDLGFILLGAMLERALGDSLDTLFRREIAQPLGMTAQFRRLSSLNALDGVVAETGATRPREPAPGQEGLWHVVPRATRLGEVDDDNAWVMDGVSGHAGLFGQARDVAIFGQAILEGRVARQCAQRDPLVVGSTRARGFDTPSLEGASCGARFGRLGPRHAVGHLGFTGTSLWVDFDRSLVVALLTNRVAFGRHNVRIREFRPLFHEAVLDALGLK